MQKIQSKEFKKFKKLKFPSEDASVPLGREDGGQTEQVRVGPHTHTASAIEGPEG